MNNNTMNVFQPDYTNILKVLNNQVPIIYLCMSIILILHSLPSAWDVNCQ